MRTLILWFVRVGGVLAFTLIARGIIEFFHALGIYPEELLGDGLVSVLTGGGATIAAWLLAGVAGVGLLVLWEWFSIGNKLAHLLPASSQRQRIRTALHQFYVAGGEIIGRRLAKDISGDDFKAYVNEANTWATETANWIERTLGPAARARFLDKGGHLAFSYSGSVSEAHATVINNLTAYRANLTVLIESEAWDRD